MGVPAGSWAIHHKRVKARLTGNYSFLFVSWGSKKKTLVLESKREGGVEAIVGGWNQHFDKKSWACYGILHQDSLAWCMSTHLQYGLCLFGSCHMQHGHTFVRVHLHLWYTQMTEIMSCNLLREIISFFFKMPQRNYIRQHVTQNLHHTTCHT